MNLTPKDVSILTQVAFKAAAESVEDPTTEEGSSQFSTAFSLFRDELFTAVEADLEKYATKPQRTEVPATPKSGAVRSTEQALQDELGATFAVEIVNDVDNGPIPAWALAKMAERGCTRVYDNRADLPEYPTRPWFKNADDTQDAYWPDKPKKAGGARKRGS
jgi:hypothetical protein